MKEKTSQEVDAELVERVKNGDNEAFSDLYTKYKGKLNYTLLKIINSPEDAEDLTSETFAKAFERINDYSTEYCFSTWLFNIGKNATFDKVRSLKRREPLIKNTISMDAPIKDDSGEEFSAFIESKTLNPLEKMERTEKHDMIREAVAGLNPTYRRLIELNYFGEMTYKEIAKEMDKPSGSVKAQLYRGKEELRQELKNNPDFIL